MKQVAFFCTSAAKGGLELNIINTAIEFKKYGIDIIIISISKTVIAELAMLNNIKLIVIDKPKKYFDVLSAIRINKIINNERIKHIVVFDNRDTDCISLLKLFNNNIKLYYHQTMQVGGNKRDIMHTLRYNRFDNWITPLSKLANEVKLLTKYPESRIRIIPIGIDHHKFIEMKTKQEAKKSLNIEAEQFVVGVIGRIDEQKGQLVALKAFSQIEYKDIMLLIVGETTYKEAQEYFQSILEFIKYNNLENKVKIIDFANNVQDIFACLDLFLLTSFSETYGFVTIEAMMSGVPIIATNSGGTPEVVNNGEFAQLVPPNNVIELKSKIVELIDNYNKYTDLAIRAKQYAIQKYTKEQEIISLKYLFESNENE